MSRNDVTGDSIATRFGSAEQQKAFDENFERIFGSRKPIVTQEEFTEWLKAAVKDKERNASCRRSSANGATSTAVLCGFLRR